MTVKCVRVAQWIRRPPTKREIAGSSPVVDFLFFLMHRDVSRNPGFESQSPPSFLTLFHISITNIPTHEFRRYIVSFTLFPLYTARMQPDISTIQTLSVCSQNIQHLVYTTRTWTHFTWVVSPPAEFGPPHQMRHSEMHRCHHMLVVGTHTVFKGHRHIGKPRHSFVTMTRT